MSQSDVTVSQIDESAMPFDQRSDIDLVKTVFEHRLRQRDLERILTRIALRSAVIKDGALYVFGAGLTPFPYKVITIASGATQLALPVFLAASVVARGEAGVAHGSVRGLAGPRPRCS